MEGGGAGFFVSCVLFFDGLGPLVDLIVAGGVLCMGGVVGGCWNPPKLVHMKCTLTKSGSTDTERKSRDKSRSGTRYLLLAGSTGSYV